MSLGGLGLSLQVDGASQATFFFEGLNRALRNFRPLFKETDTKLRKFFNRQFAGQGVGPRGGHWQQLSTKYAERKRRLRPGRKVLQFDGTLRRALVRKSGPNALRIITRDQFAFGTTGVPYASYHQYGTSKLPRRMMIDMDRVFRRDRKSVV